MAQIQTTQKHIIREGESRPLNLPNGSTLLEVPKDAEEKAKLYVVYGNKWYEKEPEDADLVNLLSQQLEVLHLMLKGNEALREGLQLRGFIP